MMLRYRFAALAVVASAGLGSVAMADTVSYGGVLNYPISTAASSFELAGQSAFIQYRNGSSTSGGQLDGLTSNLGFGGSFLELFPPPSLADYNTFAYFGVIKTFGPDRALIDTSLVVAMRPGTWAGKTVPELFPTYNEYQLVTALTTSFDSPQFDYLYDTVSNNPNLYQGAIGVPPIGRPGETLDLIAFIGNPFPRTPVLSPAVDVGDLWVSVVPSSGATALFGLAGISALRRRR